MESSKRKRTYRSCSACRGSKTKCSGERPTCRRCQDRGHTCIYSESSQPNWIQRVERISKSGQKTPSTPPLVPDRSPSNHLEQGVMQPDRLSPQSPSVPFQQPLITDPIESHNTPLDWYVFCLLPFITSRLTLLEQANCSTTTQPFQNRSSGGRVLQ